MEAHFEKQSIKIGWYDRIYVQIVNFHKVVYRKFQKFSNGNIKYIIRTKECEVENYQRSSISWPINFILPREDESQLEKVPHNVKNLLLLQNHVKMYNTPAACKVNLLK